MICYTTATGSAYVVCTGTIRGMVVRRDKLGEKHVGDRRSHREKRDNLGEFRPCVRLTSYPGDAEDAPQVGLRMAIHFDGRGDDVLYTSTIISIEVTP